MEEQGWADYQKSKWYRLQSGTPSKCSDHASLQSKSLTRHDFTWSRRRIGAQSILSGRTFLPENICMKINEMIISRKINKISGFYMIFNRKIFSEFWAQLPP